LQQQPTGPNFWDIVDTLIPVATFVLGLALAEYYRRRESERREKNLRSLLLTELKRDYFLLHRTVGDSRRDSHKPPTIARACLRLSTSVYESYLGRLDSLKSGELSGVFDAYLRIQDAIRDSDMLLSNLDNEHSDVYTRLSGSSLLEDKAKEALKATEGALRVLGLDGAALKEIVKHRPGDEYWQPD